MKTLLQLLLPALAAAIIGTGCVAPSSPRAFADPPVGEYFKGSTPNLNAKPALDPANRKFRLAYLWTEYARAGADNASSKKAVEEKMHFFMYLYMSLREQASKSRHHDIFAGTPALEAAMRKAAISGSEGPFIDLFLEKGTVGDPVGRAFGERRSDVPAIAAELAARYPNLFTTDDDGFPLDVVICGVFTAPWEMRVKTAFEAWLIGTPEHADLADWDSSNSQSGFTASECFLDPYEAIAAAVHKLTRLQFEWLEPANPKDHDWLK